MTTPTTADAVTILRTATYENSDGNVPRLPARVVDTLIDSAGVSRLAYDNKDQSKQVERLVHDTCEELLARLPSTAAIQAAGEPVYQYRQKSHDYDPAWIECDATCEERIGKGPAADCFEYRTLYTAPAPQNDTSGAAGDDALLPAVLALDAAIHKVLIAGGDYGDELSDDGLRDALEKAQHVAYRALISIGIEKLPGAVNPLRAFLPKGAIIPAAAPSPVQAQPVNKHLAHSLAGALAERLQAQPVASYTCKGKGGTYELIGRASAAGQLHDVLASNDYPVYRDTESGLLFVRVGPDFDERMELITQPTAPVSPAGVEASEIADEQWKHPDNWHASSQLDKTIVEIEEYVKRWKEQAAGHRVIGWFNKDHMAGVELRPDNLMIIVEAAKIASSRLAALRAALNKKG